MSELEILYERLEKVLSELKTNYNRYAAIEADVLKSRIALLTKAILIAMLPMVACAQKPTYDEIRAMSPADGIGYAVEMYELYEPHIVMAQAILETGWYKSDLCVKHGNLFGIYDSKAKAYKHYSHWIESVKDYRDLVQCKYEGGDYFEFLERIGYASDTDYVSKVRKIADGLIEYE